MHVICSIMKQNLKRKLGINVLRVLETEHAYFLTIWNNLGGFFPLPLESLFFR